MEAQVGQKAGVTSTALGRALYGIGCGITAIWLLSLLFGLMWFGAGEPEQMIPAFLIAFVPALLGSAARYALRNQWPAS